MAVIITETDGTRGKLREHSFTVKDTERLILDPKRKVYQRGKGEQVFPHIVWLSLIQIRIGETPMEITEIEALAEGALIKVGDDGCCASISLAPGKTLAAFGGVEIKVEAALKK
jgi:hypothetical protein